MEKLYITPLFMITSFKATRLPV